MILQQHRPGFFLQAFTRLSAYNLYYDSLVLSIIVFIGIFIPTASHGTSCTNAPRGTGGICDKVITFVAELQMIRLRLPPELRHEPVLLFLDGHPSRWDFYANLIFWTFNVDVVTFPGHCSHLLQMFDVCIASPLKIELKKELTASRFSSFLATLRPEDFRTNRKQNAREMRLLLIESFFTAFERVCTHKNCRSSFQETGISPYNPDVVLSSPYTMEPPAEGLFPKRQGPASAKWLTSDESLQEMFRHEFGRDLTPNDLRMNRARVYEDLKNADIKYGRPLSEPPDILVEQSGIYRLAKVIELQ